MNNFKAILFATVITMTPQFGAVLAADGRGADNKYAELAARLIRPTIKPGEIVAIEGGIHTMPLMEELAIAVTRIGGFAQISVETDRLRQAYWLEMPEEFLGKPHGAPWQKGVTVAFILPALEDESLWARFPKERFAIARRASRANASSGNANQDPEPRVAYLGFPSRKDAARLHFDYAEYEKLYWDEYSIDYKQLAEQCHKLQQLLSSGKNLRVTSLAGTDLTFALGPRPVVVNDGMAHGRFDPESEQVDHNASLPGGLVSFAPIESSANGHVVVPRDECDFTTVRNQTFRFENGRILEYKAEEGAECVKEVLASFGDAPQMLSSIKIGLNPGAKVMDERDYRPGHASGLVEISIGNNKYLGGSNTVERATGFSFPIVEATVTVDGRTIISGGKLSF